jgi:hypothetical protein
VAQALLILTMVHPVGLSLAECLLGPNPVVELSLCVVMQEEQPQGRPVAVTRNPPH